MNGPDVVVTLGTDHHPFDRLVEWSERWARAHPEHVVWVQYGSSRSADASVRSDQRVGYDQLTDYMRDSVVVVAHAGGGTVAQCWQVGKVPIVVPREHKLHEHVDDHQVQFARKLAEAGFVTSARTYEAFDELLTTQLEAPAATRPRVDVTGRNETTALIGRLIDDLVATDRAPGRRGLLRRRRRP